VLQNWLSLKTILVWWAEYAWWWSWSSITATMFVSGTVKRSSNVPWNGPSKRSKATNQAEGFILLGVEKSTKWIFPTPT